MIGIFFILLCWLLGNIISEWIGGYVSGNIIGMILLFLLLTLRVAKAEKVAPVAKFLLGTMALFFVPYGVGLMVSWEVLMSNFLAIVVAVVVSTVLVLVTGGKTFQMFNRKKR